MESDVVKICEFIFFEFIILRENVTSTFFLRQCNMVKWLFVISYGSLPKFSDNLNYISKGKCIL